MKNGLKLLILLAIFALLLGSIALFNYNHKEKETDESEVVEQENEETENEEIELDNLVEDDLLQAEQTENVDTTVSNEQEQ